MGNPSILDILTVSVIIGYAFIKCVVTMHALDLGKYAVVAYNIFISLFIFRYILSRWATTESGSLLANPQNEWLYNCVINDWTVFIISLGLLVSYCILLFNNNCDKNKLYLVIKVKVLEIIQKLERFKKI